MALSSFLTPRAAKQMATHIAVNGDTTYPTSTFTGSPLIWVQDPSTEAMSLDLACLYQHSQHPHHRRYSQLYPSSSSRAPPSPKSTVAAKPAITTTSPPPRYHVPSSRRLGHKYAPHLPIVRILTEEERARERRESAKFHLRRSRQKSLRRFERRFFPAAEAPRVPVNAASNEGKVYDEALKALQMAALIQNAPQGSITPANRQWVRDNTSITSITDDDDSEVDEPTVVFNKYTGRQELSFPDLLPLHTDESWTEVLEDLWMYSWSHQARMEKETIEEFKDAIIEPSPEHSFL